MQFDIDEAKFYKIYVDSDDAATADTALRSIFRRRMILCANKNGLEPRHRHCLTNMKLALKPRALVFLLTLFLLSLAAFAQARRKIIIDQDCSGPGGSNLQTVALLIQSPQVEVLGITVVSGDQWRDEEVAHTLRLLEIMGRTDIPVVPGAVFPLVRTGVTKLCGRSRGRLRTPELGMSVGGIRQRSYRENWPKARPKSNLPPKMPLTSYCA